MNITYKSQKLDQSIRATALKKTWLLEFMKRNLFWGWHNLMSATYVHAIIAELLSLKIRKFGKGLITKEYQGVISENSILIQAGAFCPDLPYLDEAISGKIPYLDIDEQKRWGDLMHYVNTGKLILFAVEFLKEKKNKKEAIEFNRCFQWFLGFVSHMIVDAVIHPIVEGIVGPYLSNEVEHRKCEMVQDVWLNMEVYDEDIPQLDVISVTKYLKAPEIIEFWESLLTKCYNFYYVDEKPKFQEWIEDYQQKLKIASGVTSSFGSYHGLTYPTFDEAKTKKEFLENLRTPSGKEMNFKEIVYNHMIPTVIEFWEVIIDGIEGKTDKYRNIFDFDMDSGKYIRTGNFVAW